MQTDAGQQADLCDCIYRTWVPTLMVRKIEHDSHFACTSEGREYCTGYHLKELTMRYTCTRTSNKRILLSTIQRHYSTTSASVHTTNT